MRYRKPFLMNKRLQFLLGILNWVPIYIYIYICVVCVCVCVCVREREREKERKRKGHIQSIDKVFISLSIFIKYKHCHDWMNYTLIINGIVFISDTFAIFLVWMKLLLCKIIALLSFWFSEWALLLSNFQNKYPSFLIFKISTPPFQFSK